MQSTKPSKTSDAVAGNHQRPTYLSTEWPYQSMLLAIKIREDA
jgi:hypothetical protein